MATVKKKETREEILARVSKEYNITPKATGSNASSKGTIIASSKGSPSTYKANRTAEEQKQVNQSIIQKYNQQYVEKKKQETPYNYKWYSGTQPTASETMAQIFRQANGDEGFFNRLNELFDEETQNRGSIIYSPYRQATNYKAIEGLQQLGIEVPDVISDDWIDSMWREYAPYARETTTGYGPSAPTKTSSVQENAAYWLKTLKDDQENTRLAEAQLQSLYKEVEYLTGQGYSDAEIVKRVRQDFSGKYNVLNKMDEGRIEGDALRLNRAVDYNGDDTINGMIWAARNGGGSGSYFEDAVHQHLRQGNLYKYDPNSEAALDPSNYEGYDPYSRGGTLHDLQMKYGASTFDQEWLDANRSTMVSTPEGVKDIENIKKSIENYDKATAELAELDKWLEKRVNSTIDGKPITAEELTAMLEALIEEGKDNRIEIPTLKKMEDQRYAGTYLALSGAVPFTLPQYIEKAEAMIAERDAAAAQAETEKSDKDGLLKRFWNWIVGDRGERAVSSNFEDVVDVQNVDDLSSERIKAAASEYAKGIFGIELPGEVPPSVEAALKDAIVKVNKASAPDATKADEKAARLATDDLWDVFKQDVFDTRYQTEEAAASEPVADTSYETSEAWTSVIDGLSNPREGMAEVTAEPTAYNEGEPAAEADTDSQMLESYANILQGGEWDGYVVDWAFAHSNNNMSIMGELVDGIVAHKTKGEPLTGIAKSWWDKFGGLVDDLGGPETYDQLDRMEMGLDNYDSRRAYGTQVYGALKMNEEAYESGAIEADVYAQNLVSLSDLAESISGMTNGERATDEQADNFIQNSIGATDILNAVYNSCNAGMEDQRKREAADLQQRQAANTEVLRQLTAGETITDVGALFDVLTTDISDAASEDVAYQEASAFINRVLGFDSISEDGIAFTTGDAGMDASYGKDYLMAECSALYSKGVTAVAQAALDRNMRFATACGMTLEQFYEAFPTYARTPGQLAAEARSEYHGAWGEFGLTLEGLTAANESIENAGAEAVAEVQSDGVLAPSEIIALAYDKVSASNLLNLDKTLYMMQHAWKDETIEQDILLKQYGDRTGVGAEWDKVIAGREADQQNVYNNSVAKINGVSYEDWLTENGDKALNELKARRDTAKDILDLGDPAKWQAEQAIVKKTGNVANIDKFVAEHGSEMDKKVYEGVTSLMQTGQFMYQSVMLGGGYAASLAATLTGSGGEAFDRFMESGDYDAALMASAGAWLVNAAIETTLDRFLPEGMGGDREWKMVQARANLAKMGMFDWMKDPKSMSKAAQSVLNLAVGGAMNASGEGVEEALQNLVDSLADNVVYGTGILPTGEQLTEAGKAFTSGMFMGAILEGGSNLVFGTPKITDVTGNAISKAEAQLLPETDGVILNSAIEFEATAMAIANSQEALAQIEASPENQQLQQSAQQMQEIDAELAEAETELAAAEEEQANAALALEAVDNERVESDVFTEDMSKRMVAAATNLQAAGQNVSKSRERAEAARARKAEAQKHHDELKAKVQSMYDQVMDEAKTKYTQVVTEKYYSGDNDAQRKSGEAYQAACKEMQDIKKQLAEAKAEMDTYGTGTPRGEQARKNYGRRLLELDRAADKVAKAKAEMDIAYTNTPEKRMESVHNAELAKAEQVAAEATEAAAADPTNMRKAQAADVEQARLETIRAKQELEEARSSISERLKSPDSKTRDQAVSDWKALQQKANDAANLATELEAEFNETDTQKNLRAAIDNMKQYSNMDLMDENSENHEAAVRAYADLQMAQAAVELEKAWADLLSDEISANSVEYDNAVNAYKKAVDKRNQGLVSVPGVVWAYDLEEGDVFTNQDQGQYFAALRGMQYSGEKRLLTNDGGFIVPTKTSLIFSKGDYDNPEIYGIIKVVGNDSDYVQHVVTELEDVLNDEKLKGGLSLDAAMEIIPYLFPEGDVRIYGRTREGYEVRTGRGERSVSGAANSGNRSDGSRSSDIQAWRNSGRPGNRGISVKTSNGAAVEANPIEIMRDLTDSIQVGYSPNGPMNEGRKRVSSDILAFYNNRANGIRVRSKYAGDLAIGLHEFGHAAHARLKGLHATQAMIDALPDSVKASYTDAELDGEAIAEFVVEYMYGRDRAVRAAGEQFVRDFEHMMRADPDLNAAISRGRDQVELWNNASAAERAAAMIKDSTTAKQRDKAASNKGGAKRVIERVITEVFDANEPLRKLGKNVYDAAKWSRWASQRADVLMTRNFIDPEGNIIGKSLTERLDDIGFTADMEIDAATYGVLQVALERLEQKKPVFAENEFSRDSLIAAMDEIKGRNPIAAEAADVLTGFWKDVMDVWLVPSGLVNEDVRNSLWEMYPHYLPTKRVVDVDWSKKDVKSGTFKLWSAKEGGVSLEVINPFQSIADMVDQAVRSVSRNQVMQEIDAALSGGGLEWLAEEITEDMAVTKIDTDKVKSAVQTAFDSGTNVDPDLAADAFNLLDDMEEQWRSTGRSLRPNVITGKRADGTSFYYQIQQGNEDLFKAAMGSKATANSLIRAVKKANNAFTQLTTQKNPVFAIKNAERDFATSVNTGTWAYTYLDGAAKWMWGLYQIATDSKLYQEFESVGGGSHTRLSGISEKKLRELRREILGKKDSLPVRAAKLGMKIITLSSINDIVEVNSRFVEYALGKHDRSTFEGKREAAIAAQDVTVDFGMGGASKILQDALAFIPFGRAALNGTYKSMMMVRNIGSSDPRVRKQAAAALTKTVVNNGIMAALQAYLVGALLGGDDDERKKEEYALITDEMKAGNFMIPLNQDRTNAKGFDRPWLRIPLPQDAISRATYALTLNAVFKMSDADELTVDMMNVAKSLVTDSLPGEVITANISNAMMNRTWYGGEIVSSYLMDNRSGVNQYKDDTPSAFKALSNAIYNVSGKEISPAVLQYVFEQSFGYIGKVVMPLISGNRYTGDWTVSDAGKNLVYSFMKNFTLDPLVSNDLSQQYDDVTEKIDKIVSEADEGLPITYLAYSLTDSEREDAVVEAKYLQKGLMKRVKAENNALWQEIRDIESNPRLSDSEKAIQAREVRREIDHNTTEALAELGEYMQTYVYRDPLIENVLHLFDPRPTLD